MFAEVAGDAGSVRAGALDAHALDGAVRSEERGERRVPGRGRWELRVREIAAVEIDDRVMVGVLMGIDPGDDFHEFGWRDDGALPVQRVRRPAGRADRTLRGPLARLL